MIVGIDLGGMSAKAACVEKGTKTEVVRIATSSSDPAKQTISSLAHLAESAAEAAGIPFDSIEAIGVGAPGIVDSGAGVVAAWTNFGWKDVPLSKELSELTKKPVFILNDANAAALGEATYGAGRHFSDCVLVTLGTGVGGGVVLGGKLFEGFKGAGGEIGHTVIRAGGRKCSCGRRGCLETYVSTRALIADTVSAARREPQGALSKALRAGRKPDGFLLFEGLDMGDPGAEKVFQQYISMLGEGILNLASLFRPQAVLLGGGISAEGERLLGPLRKYVDERLTAAEYAPLQILAAELGNDAGILGAAEFARQKVGKDGQN